MHDLRFAARSFARTPGVTIAAVLSIALGIAATTSVFTLVNAVLFKPMPVKDPNQLVALYTTEPDARYPGSFSYLDYRDYRDGNDVFSDLFTHDGTSAAFSSGGDKSELVWTEIVSGNYFTGLGVVPSAGRVLTPDDDRASAHPAIVLSYAFWQRRFGGDPTVIGKVVKLTRREFTVVGVASKGFSGTRLLGFIPDLWVPLSMRATMAPDVERAMQDRAARWFNLNGRLKPGVSIDQATAAMNVIAERLARQYPVTNARTRVGMVPGGNKTQPAITLLGYVPITARTMMAVVGLVLLIACANVANLLLARASTRRREIAMRLACGAPRTRVVGQLLTESVLLAVSGGLGGLLLARWFSALLPLLAPPLDFATIDFAYDLSLDYRVLIFATVTTIATGIVFGLLPALQASKVDLVRALQTRDVDDSRSRRMNLRQALVIAQVAFTLALVIGAGAFVRSMQNAQHIDPGFETKNVVLTSVDLGLRGYDAPTGLRFLRNAEERIKALPGVAAVSDASPLPLDSYGSAIDVTAEGYVPRDAHERVEVGYSVVGADYFRAMNTTLVSGRPFAETDTDATTRVAIVNEAMARRFWPSADAIGRHFRIGNGKSPEIEIVGIARTGKYNLLGEPPTEYFFLPLAQNYHGQVTLIVRTTGSPATLAPAVQREIAALDPDVPIFGVKTMPIFLDRLLSLPMTVAVLVTVFASIALVMASVGLFAVINFTIARRTKEIGLRIAVGAGRSDVMWMVLRQGMTLAGIGMIIGVGAALALMRLMASLLYGIGPNDPESFVLGAILLVSVALAATYVPARRAMRLSPTIALRYE